ncbi:MAG TPA: RNA polymerase sigma factor [Gemmatimonadaceae bacterium]
MDQRSDAEIVDAVLDGDADAYAILFARYRDAYTRYAIRLLGSRDDAEEALLAAFLRAYRALGQCRDPARFGAWLRRIVMNECRTRATRRGRRERYFVRDAEALDAVLAPDPREDGALREEIQLALDRLDVAHREAFLLKHVEELSYEEMAALTGAGVSALKMRVKRACDRLRELLEEVHRP